MRLFAILVGIGAATSAIAHPGGLAADGCHNDRKNGGRHATARREDRHLRLIARSERWAALMAKKEYAVGEGLTEIFTQLMAYNMKKKSNRDDLIDSCAYDQKMIDNNWGIIREQAQGVQNFEATAKRETTSPI